MVLIFSAVSVSTVGAAASRDVVALLVSDVIFSSEMLPVGKLTGSAGGRYSAAFGRTVAL